MNRKPIIYQLLPRLFTNYNEKCMPNGTLEQNGSGKLNDITPKVLDAIKQLGVTHVWYTGVIEHAHCADYSDHGIERDNRHVVKGQAGSPYAISDYYDIDPDLAVNVDKRMDEFEALVKRTHETGLKVIIDFVPNQVARRYHSDAAPTGIKDLGADDDNSKFFSPFNNFYYVPRQKFSPSVDMGSGNDAYVEFPAKASGNDCFTAFPGRNDWYDTVKLNYGVDYGDNTQHFHPIPDTWFKMLHILRYWASKGIDGFRCDMVHMVPLEFWQWAIPIVKEHYPEIVFIAEIYDPALYRDFINLGGFDYLYDKVNLYDTLRGIQTSDVSAAQITGCWQTVEGIAGNMLNFLENHDEQRFASAFYAGDPVKVIPSLVVSSMISTGPMMIYAGQELGEPAADAEGYSGYDGRTTIFDYWSVDTLRRWLNGGNPSEANLSPRERWLRNAYCRILGICGSEKAIGIGRFFDLMYVNYNNPTLNPHRQYVFIRSYDDEALVVAVNFGAESCDMKVNVPKLAFEMLQIPEGTTEMVELLTGDKATVTFSSTTPLPVFLKPYGAAVWKVVHKNNVAAGKKKVVQSGKKSKKS